MKPADADGSQESVRAKLKISTAYWQLEMTLEVPRGPLTPLDLLAAAQQVSSAVVDTANRAVSASGRAVSCRSGCGACCRQLVAISAVEAESLARLIAAMPMARQKSVRARFAAAVQRLEAEGLLDPLEPLGHRSVVAENHGSRQANLQLLSQRYFKLQVPCPFLENESCSVYENRPLVCREYHVTSPALRCEKLFDAPVERVDMPIRMADVLTRSIHRLTQTPPYAIPLILSLEWAQFNSSSLEQRYDGTDALKVFIAEIEHEVARSASDRS